MEIKTDGSVTPEEAFQKSVSILIEQFSAISAIDENDYEAEKKEQEENEAEEENRKEAVKKEDKKKADKSELLEKDAQETLVGELKSFSTRTLNVLEKSQIEKVKDILKLTEDQINELRGMGAKGIKEIKKAIGDFGFTLKK